jgi:hypothetical protein
LFGWNVRLLTAKLHQQEGKGTLAPPALRRPVERTVAAAGGQTAARCVLYGQVKATRRAPTTDSEWVVENRLLARRRGC